MGAAAAPSQATIPNPSLRVSAVMGVLDCARTAVLRACVLAAALLTLACLLVSALVARDAEADGTRWWRIDRVPARHA